MGRGSPPSSRGRSLPTAARGSPGGRTRLPGTKAERDFLKKHKGGGFLDTITSIPGDFLSGGFRAAQAAPGGIYSQIADPIHDAAKALSHLATGPLETKRGRDPFSRRVTKLQREGFRSDDLAKAMAIGVKETVRHPLRDPFATATLGMVAVNPALGLGMRTTAGLRAASAVGRGEKITAFKIGAGEKPVYVRILEVEGAHGPISVRAPAFRSPAGIAAQKMMDRARRRFPEGFSRTALETAHARGKGGKLATTGRVTKALGAGAVGQILSPAHGGLRRKISFESHQRRRVLDSIAESPAALMQEMGKTFTEGQQAALYVVGIGKNPGGRGANVFVRDHIAYHKQKIVEGVGSKKGHENWIKWLEEADNYIYNTKHGPKIKKDAEHGDLLKAHYLMDQLAKNREQLWGDLGVLDPEAAALRRSHPAQEIKYGGLAPDEPGGQLPAFVEAEVPDLPPEGGLPRGLLTNEEFQQWAQGTLKPIEGPRPKPEPWQRAEIREKPPIPGGPRIPELGARPQRTVRSTLRSFMPGFTTRERVPATLTHEYHAELLRSGKMRPMFTQFMAESVVEAERFAALLRGRREIQEHSHVGAKGEFDIPMNIGALSEGDAMYQGIFAKLNANIPLDAVETRHLGVAYDFYRQKMFPDPAATAQAKAYEIRHYQTIGGEQGRLRVEQLNTESGLPDGWAWVDRRDLADLHKVNPQIAKHWVAKTAGNIVDAINDASRLAFIYLKLGYIPANLLGNTAMIIVQSGFAAIPNLMWAAKANSKLAKGEAAMLDRIMGLGVSSLSRSSTQVLHELSTWVAGKQARIIDVVPRRAAFLHEARKAGWTDEDIGKFLDRTKRGHAPSDNEMMMIRNAKEAIGDYERLSSFEKGVLRRIIFFYPWLKVATRMTGRTLIEHPYKSAFLTQTAGIGEQRQEEAFGFSGMPAGYEGLIPVSGGNVIDPRAVAIWSTPADIGRSIAGLAQGEIPPAYNITQFGTPLIGAAQAALTRTDIFGNPRDESALHIFWNELGPQIPTWRAIKKTYDPGDQSNKLYPQSPLDAWLQWGTSGWRGNVNVEKLREWLEEQRGE